MNNSFESVEKRLGCGVKAGEISLEMIVTLLAKDGRPKKIF